MNIRIFAISLILTLTTVCLANAAISIQNLKVGKMCISYSSERGYNLRYAGASVIHESTFYATNPEWTKTYFGNSRGERVVNIWAVEGGKSALIKMSTPSFIGTNLVTLLENKVIIDQTYNLIEDANDVTIEYNQGYISAPLITGDTFHAQTAKGECSGIVPLMANSADWKETSLTDEPFRKITIDSKIGKLSIEISDEPDGLSLYDTRKMPPVWAKKNPVFWLGKLAYKIKKGQRFHTITTITIDPISKPKVTSSITNKASITLKEYKSTHISSPQPVVVIPEPKEMTFNKRDFLLTNKTQLVVSNTAEERDLLGARVFAAEVKYLYGIKLGIVRESQIKKSVGKILIGEMGRNLIATNVAKKRKLSIPNKEEGYTIDVTSDKILVVGNDCIGSYYGMQTLLQLIKASADKISIQGCQINDYPSLKFRGAFLFTGKDAHPFHKKLIDRILARYKINQLVLGIDYIKWKSAPEIAISSSMEQTDLKEEIQYAKEHFIDSSPMIQSLGHCQWMFSNKQNIDLAEDPYNPDAYCPSNPRT
jgi:hypothetical protein